MFSLLVEMAILLANIFMYEHLCLFIQALKTHALSRCCNCAGVYIQLCVTSMYRLLFLDSELVLHTNSSKIVIQLATHIYP